MDTLLSIGLAKHVLLLFSIILAAGTAVGVVARALRIPDVAVFLVIWNRGLQATVAGSQRSDKAMTDITLI